MAKEYFMGVKDGVSEFTLPSWSKFSDFVQEILNYRHYIWRGQRCSDWHLETTLDREIASIAKGSERTDAIHNHLEGFKFAIRGRRGTNPPNLKEEDDWWALGQHHGLATRLLDWTKSPYVAAYFAFAKVGTPQTPERAIFALSGSAERDGVVFVRPHSDENARLVNQGGLFTRAPDDEELESWVRNKYAGQTTSIALAKITIPDKDRELCLRSLNRMNINHLTLFPDLYGASAFCNMDLRIKDY